MDEPVRVQDIPIIPTTGDARHEIRDAATGELVGREELVPVWFDEWPKPQAHDPA